jgi:hypothetical protein
MPSRGFSSSKASKAIIDGKNMKANWQVCREISGLSLVCRGSKSLRNTVIHVQNVVNTKHLKIFFQTNSNNTSTLRFFRGKTVKQTREWRGPVKFLV